jgi:amidase
MADRERFALAHQWRQLFAQWDVVLCPAVSVTAGLHDATPFETRRLSIDGQDVPYGMLPFWAGWATPTGQPVTTMPIGHDAAGLPIGMQIIGPRLEDRTTIAFASLVEEAFGGFVIPPDYAG